MAVLYDEKLSKNEILKRVGNLERIAGIRKTTVAEGSAKGNLLIEVANGGGMEYCLSADQCLDIVELKYKGVNIGFFSNNGMQNRTSFNPHETEFLQYFPGGFLYTCGLSSTGPNGRDTDGSYHPIHGRIANLPANSICCDSAWQGDDYTLRVKGEMREGELFGKNLKFTREITTLMGEKSILIRDTLENQDCNPCEFMLLYHFNIGYPLVDEESRFFTDATKISPRTADVAEAMSNYSYCMAPVDNAQEAVFFHEFDREQPEWGNAALINYKKKLGVRIQFKRDELPVLAQWRCMRSGTYVVGIEPTNNYIMGRASERANGTIKTIEPYETKVFEICLQILEGWEDIKQYQ